MAVFPSIDPSYGAQKRSEPVVRTVQFGDGYQARLSFGFKSKSETVVFGVEKYY
jgi:phage-related protein